MIIIKQLQAEVAEWATRNFPDEQPHQPLLGMSEEVGELCHAHLKLEQGIRGDADTHRLAKNDALGDLFIFAAHYCALNGIDLETAIEVAWAEVKKRDWRKDPKNGGKTA